MRRTKNLDFRKRDEILGFQVDWRESSGIEYFKNISIEHLRTLLNEGFMDPGQTQNDSPSIRSFMDFMEDYPQCYAHGYAVSPYRSDYGIVIEGLFCPWKDVEGNKNLQIAFLKLCRRATELDVEEGKDWRSWWD